MSNGSEYPIRFESSFVQSGIEGKIVARQVNQSTECDQFLSSSNITHIVIFCGIVYLTFGGLPMNGGMLRDARRDKGMTQVEAAQKLGVSQTYLSLFEKGKRTPSGRLAKKVVDLFGMPVTAYPLEKDFRTVRAAKKENLVRDLAALGYPGFSHLKGTPAKNPAEVLLAALASDDLDGRSVEALPWLILTFDDLQWSELVDELKLRNLQNRLGFLVAVAADLANRNGRREKSMRLQKLLANLEKSRLANEGLLCRRSMPESEKRWIREYRSAAAVHWNMLSDLTAEGLRYVG